MKPAICAMGLVVSAWLLSVAWVFASADEPNKFAPPADTKESVMRRKLTEAQKVLEGLALNDFNKIKLASDELSSLRKKAAWPIYKTKDYELYSSDFQRQIESLQKAAKAKNIDAATLAYVDMTLTCVACHQHVRETGVATAPSQRPDQRLAQR